MPIVSPREITVKAENAYPRFLKQWICGQDDGFFPYRVRVRLSVDASDPSGTIVASEKLLAHSKEKRGWGYTVHRQQVRMRDFGNNPVPKAIAIDTLDDLLRLAGKTEEFAATRLVVDRLRSDLPHLDEWLKIHVRSLAALVPSIDGLIAVTQYFRTNPRPDCYARQIPVSVDTKFVERHSAILRQWLDLLLPATGIDVNETKFSRRFGLRDGQPYRAVRLLDPRLRSEFGLSHDELALPLRSIAELPVIAATVFIVENDLNLLTLPSFRRGIAIRGEGNAVNRLERVPWLRSNRVLYWGDIDVEGFQILSRLRNLLEHVESFMMDRNTLQCHEEFIVPGNALAAPAPSNLTADETAAFANCAANNHRLEQEKILQPFVDETMAKLNTERPSINAMSRLG